MKKIKLKLILSAVTVLLPFGFLFAAPQQPVNGGTGISNNNSNTIKTTSPVNLPHDINLQNAYNQSIAQSQNYIQLSSPGLQIQDNSGNPLITFSYTGNTQLQSTSTTQGTIPFPPMNSSQISAINLSGAAPGWGSYNTTENTLQQYDGSQLQSLLTTNHVLQGANMIITDNGNGTVTFASTGGGGPSATQIQGSFSSFSPTTATPVTNLDTPIAVASGGFTPINPVGTNVALMTINGVQTPIIQNTSTTGRWVTVNYDLTLLINTNASETYSFSVFTNHGLVAFPKQMTIVGNTPFYQTFEFTTPVVYLNSGDYVYLTVASSLSSGPTFNAYYFNGRLLDTTIAGIPNTDALAQGSNNLYLSQNGGSTYQYMSGSGIVGDLPKFNSTAGQLIDSGIPSSNVIQTSTSLGGSLSGTLPNPSLSSTGIGQIIAITQVTGSITMTDSAPTNRYVSELTGDSTFTLPASMTIGHTLEIFGGSAGHITIGQNAGQKITTSVGGSTVSTTVGTAGYVQLSNYNDCITLVYNGSGEFVIANSQTSGSGIVLN